MEVAYSIAMGGQQVLNSILKVANSIAMGGHQVLNSILEVADSIAMGGQQGVTKKTVIKRIFFYLRLPQNITRTNLLLRHET